MAQKKFRVYADGSLLSDSPNAGIVKDVFQKFFLSTSLLDEVLQFDGEIATIRTDLPQLQCHLEKIHKSGVILCNSRAALLAGWFLTIILKTQDILDCRYHLDRRHHLKNYKL
ncbi:hypothetical protein CDAR_77991 [Caerostris darwini]|uniref:Uncharacterized protein n=1 Tax=Caerostris darwini TaxID=1538125 RepID=A0AAV4RQ36_9ARAC|nr:hypothetical protein CDAR_77991 [Caerostris darwini]